DPKKGRPIYTGARSSVHRATFQNGVGARHAFVIPSPLLGARPRAANLSAGEESFLALLYERASTSLDSRCELSCLRGLSLVFFDFTARRNYCRSRHPTVRPFPSVSAAARAWPAEP